MTEPAPRRIADADKRTARLVVRLTRLEAAEVERRARQHDPPTVAAWLRDLIAGDLAGRRPKPPA
jgi:hypothetical protein